jgi:alanine dehydrogenase
MSLVLTQSEIAGLIDMDLALQAVEAAFAAHGSGRVNMPPKSYLDLDQGDFRAMYGAMTANGRPVCGLKWVNVHPQNSAKNLPTVMAKIVLNDPDTGLELADLDGTLITNFRTGAAGGVAAKYLAREHSTSLGLIGAGVQAWYLFEAVSRVCNLTQVFLYDHHCRRCEDLAEKIAAEGVQTFVVTDQIEAVRDLDLVATSTPSRAGHVLADWVSPGTTILAIGADAAGKQELDPALLGRARVIVDDPAQAIHSGEINVALSNGIFEKSDIQATLGQVVTANKEGRTGDDQILIFDSTGLIIQDLAVADAAYRRALETGVGRQLDFLG